MLAMTGETAMATKALINFRADPEVAAELKERAANERRPLAQFVANLVKDHLAAEKAKQQQRIAA
jgi:hypothetical protein